MVSPAEMSCANAPNVPNGKANIRTVAVRANRLIVMAQISFRSLLAPSYVWASWAWAQDGIAAQMAGMMIAQIWS